MLKPAWAVWSRGSKGSSEEENVLPANEKEVRLGQTQLAPTSQRWQAAQREWERNKCSPSCSFQKNKASRSLGVCLKLKNVYSLEHLQPKTYITPGITKTTGVGKEWGGKKLNLNFISIRSIEIWQALCQCARLCFLNQGVIVWEDKLSSPALE